MILFSKYVFQKLNRYIFNSILISLYFFGAFSHTASVYSEILNNNEANAKKTLNFKKNKFKYKNKEEMKTACEADGKYWKDSECLDTNYGIPFPVSVCFFSPLCITDWDYMNLVQANIVFGASNGYTGIQVGPANVSNGPTLVQGSIAFNYASDDSFLQLNFLGANISKSYTAIQIAAFANLADMNEGSVSYQNALINITGNVYGMQHATLMNGTKNLYGLQFAGFANVSEENTYGMQLSILYNKSKSLNGLQVALFNTIDNPGYAGFTFGMQFGLFNYSSGNAGFQLGAINYSDSKAALQIGIINYAKENPIPFLPIVNFNF